MANSTKTNSVAQVQNSTGNILDIERIIDSVEGGHNDFLWDRIASNGMHAFSYAFMTIEDISKAAVLSDAQSTFITALEAQQADAVDLIAWAYPNTTGLRNARTTPESQAAYEVGAVNKKLVTQADQDLQLITQMIDGDLKNKFIKADEAELRKISAQADYEEQIAGISEALTKSSGLQARLAKALTVATQAKQSAFEVTNDTQAFFIIDSMYNIIRDGADFNKVKELLKKQSSSFVRERIMVNRVIYQGAVDSVKAIWSKHKSNYEGAGYAPSNNMH